MPWLMPRFIQTRMRRLFQLLTLTCSIIIIVTIASKWPTTTLSPDLIEINRKSNDALHQRRIEPVVPDEYEKEPKIESIVDPPKRQQHEFLKYVHLDLKGAPPKANAFYPKFFEFFDKLNIGIKGFVIEYEDTLPLEGRLANTTHRQAYTKADIDLIRIAAGVHQFEIVPLIQTFGHLEWLLKLQEFELYRDDIGSPMVITPCLDSTYILLNNLLTQTLDLHPNSNIIHIGCDEVVLTNSHPQCQDSLMGIPERYVDHVKRVVNIVQKHRPGIRVLIWDDVIRGEQFIGKENLLEQLKGLVEPVAWHYRPTFEDSYISSPIWSVYSKLFAQTWAASAFKGGLNRMSMQTNSTHHVLNNRAWRQLMDSPTMENTPLSAIILTGWSRFDHFMPLCDLLPTAYESLIASLHMLNTGEFIINDYTNDCHGLLSALGKDTGLCQDLPGVSIWSSIVAISISLTQIEDRLTFLHTVAPSYNRKHLFVRRYELDSRLAELQALQNNLLTLSQILQGHLTELYQLDVIDEWIDLYLNPILERVNTTLIEFQQFRTQSTWPRRPLV